MPGSLLPTPQDRLASASDEDLLDEHIGNISACLPAALAGTRCEVLIPLAEKGIGETDLLAGGVADKRKWMCTIPPRSRARLHAPSRTRACGYARVHAREISHPLTVVKLQESINHTAPQPPSRRGPRRLAVYCGIWRKISENPCQMSSQCSPDLTSPKHTKHTRRAGKTEGRPPQHDENDPKEVGGGTSPRKRVHTCTPCMLARERRSTERKDLEKQRR